MKTSQDYTIKNYRGYGKITVPAGTRLTHQTATGIDKKYHFVAEYGWIDKNYPEISNILKMDVSTYGIDVPDVYVSHYPNLNTVKVFFENPIYNYVTSVSAETTEETAKKYFVGTSFDVGCYPEEITAKCIGIEFTDENI